ncbi:MAG: fasciclin domain-containing protein [Cyanobacteria bacterium P01_H01_bin.74]
MYFSNLFSTNSFRQPVQSSLFQQGINQTSYGYGYRPQGDLNTSWNINNTSLYNFNHSDRYNTSYYAPHSSFYNPGGFGGFFNPNFLNRLSQLFDNLINRQTLNNTEGRTALRIADRTEDTSTLASLIDQADLVPAVRDLERDGPITILAPTNDAFGALPTEIVDKLLLEENKSVLQEILSYHVQAGAIDLETAGNGVAFDSLLDEDQTVIVGNGADSTIINGDQIIQGAQALNGRNGSIVIPIDQVLIPPGLDLSTL